jgi:hypothetical protein
MDPLSLAIIAINGLGLVLNNPARGGGSSVKFAEAAELLGLLGAILTEGDDAYEDLKEFTAMITSMVEMSRDPSRVEWAALRARGQDAHDRLQEVKEEILGETETETPEEPTPAPEAPAETEEPSAAESEGVEPTP